MKNTRERCVNVFVLYDKDRIIYLNIKRTLAYIRMNLVVYAKKKKYKI